MSTGSYCHSDFLACRLKVGAWRHMVGTSEEAKWEHLRRGLTLTDRKHGTIRIPAKMFEPTCRKKRSSYESPQGFFLVKGRVLFFFSFATVAFWWSGPGFNSEFIWLFIFKLTHQIKINWTELNWQIIVYLEANAVKRVVFRGSEQALPTQ